MRILVVSDIHANLTALDAVLNHAGQVDSVWCLGDLVGYGPDPNQCIERIQQLPGLVCLIGNHDAAVMGRIEISSFNSEARAAVLWTRSVINQQNLDFLFRLSPNKMVDSIYLAHGSPRDPVWEYILDIRTAVANFNHFETPFCFVGHSHFPLRFQMENQQEQAELFIPQVDTATPMIPRAIFNPGSVGQPRDRDARAAYAVYESDHQTWTLHRVDYDIPSVQIRMREANLPAKHIQRLGAGW